MAAIIYWRSTQNIGVIGDQAIQGADQLQPYLIDTGEIKLLYNRLANRH